jgi:hypothetical protein
MSLQSITNQIEARNRSVGSNPTPSELYHYSDLRSKSNTAVTKESKKPFVRTSFDQRGGYDLTAEAYLWHPDPAVNRMWARQHDEANRQ